LITSDNFDEAAEFVAHVYGLSDPMAMAMANPKKDQWLMINGYREGYISSKMSLMAVNTKNN